MELIKLLPHHSFIYFADTANCPYGPKSKEEIIRLSVKITDFLIAKGTSTIVVACNTATASAIDYLRTNYTIPFVGMEPAVKPAALATKTNSIGVLATAGTFNGRLYKETSQKYAATINVNYQIGEGLVELVEQQNYTSEEAMALLSTYIKPMIDENIDHLVLGCTHYPFFIPLLKRILPKSVTIVNPAPAVAKQASRIVCEAVTLSQLSENSFVQFFSSGNIEVLKKLVEETEILEGVTFPNKSFIGNYNL